MERKDLFKALQQLHLSKPPFVSLDTNFFPHQFLGAACAAWSVRTAVTFLNPDSPDEMASGQLRAPISVVISNLYAGSGSRVLTDATGERRNRQFCQRFRGLRSCRPNPSGESGIKKGNFRNSW